MERRSFVGYAVSAVTSLALLTGCIGGGTEDGDDDDEEGDGGEPPEETGISLAETEFEVLESGGGTRGDEVTVDTDAEARTVTVEGVLTGNNSCYTAELESVEYDGVEDILDVNVRSYEDRDEDEMCAQVIKEIEYRLVAQFKDGLPGRTVVMHNGDRVAEASHDGNTGS